MDFCLSSRSFILSSLFSRLLSGLQKLITKYLFAAVGSSVANSSQASNTYIRSQYNLNPPSSTITGNTSLMSDRLMDTSLTSPDDLPPLPGYDPSLTGTAPSDGPPSTIGDPDNSVTGSVIGITVTGAIPAQPPKVPSSYLSSAMSTSSGDSSSNNGSGNGNGNNVINLNNRRQSSSSQSSSHLRSFSSALPPPTSHQPPKNLGISALTQAVKHYLM